MDRSEPGFDGGPQLVGTAARAIAAPEGHAMTGHMDIRSTPCACSNEAEDDCRACNKPICEECSVEIREGKSVVPTCLVCARRQLKLDQVLARLRGAA